MTTRPTIAVDDNLLDYVLANSMSPDAVQQSLMDATARAVPGSTMPVSADEGAFLTLITRLVGARNAVEVGTFTGYSSLCIARGLADGGRLTCCDVNEKWTSIAREHWKKAGVADRVELKIAPAIQTLRALPSEPMIDLAFIDADKESYVDYWEELVPRVRPGGVLLVDNTLWSGRVVHDDQDATTRAIARFNAHVHADRRVDAVVLTVSDGLTFAVKR